MKKFLSVLFIILCSYTRSTAQGLTINDFKLCLDDIACSDSSAVSLTKKQLLSAKQVTANSSQFQIKSFTISIGYSIYTSAAIVTFNEGSIISSKTKKRFKQLIAGNRVSIQAQGCNQKNEPVQLAPLYIDIK